MHRLKPSLAAAVLHCDRMLDRGITVPESGHLSTGQYQLQHPDTFSSTCGLFLLYLAPRGFHVCYIREDTAVPERVDLKSGSVSTILQPCHKFRISFDARGPRDDIKVGVTRGGTGMVAGTKGRWMMQACGAGLQ